MKYDFILLAAGKSSRMGSPKPLLKISRYSFIDYILLNIKGIRFNRRFVVLGHNYSQILEKQEFPEDVEVVINEDYGRGQISSLQKVLQNLNSGSAGILMQLVDCPLVSAGTYKKILRHAGKKRIVIPEYNSKGGHPVFFGKNYFEPLLELRGKGAREIVYSNPQSVVRVETDDFAVCFDVDTQEDYEKLKRISGIKCK